MPGEQVCLQVIASFFGTETRLVGLEKQRSHGTLVGHYAGRSCVLEPRSALPQTTPRHDVSGVHRSGRGLDVELVGIRLPGPTGPTAPDAGYAVSPDGEVLCVGHRHEDPSVGLGAYWRRIAEHATDTGPVALAHAATLFARPDLGVQNLILTTDDLMWPTDLSWLRQAPGFTELVARRGPGLTLDLAFCSYRARFSESDLAIWRIASSPDGALTVTATQN